MLKLLTRLTSRHPLAVILALAAVTAALSPALLQPRFDVSVESFLTEEELREYHYQDFQRAFGEDNDVVIIFQVDDPYSDATLGMLKRIAQRVRNVAGVQMATSIAEAVLVERQGPMPTVKPLVSSLPLNDEQRSLLRRTVESKEIYNGKLISLDRRFVSLNIAMDDPARPGMSQMRINEARREQIESILSAVNAEAGDTPRAVAGWPFIKLKLNEAVFHDLMLIAPAIALVSMLFLWFGFRSIYALLAGGASVSAAVLWTVSTFFLAGRTINIASAMLPTLVMAIAFAQLIFIIAQYGRSEGSDEERIRETIAKAAPPCFLCSLTTAAGFLSLTATNIGPIQEFGVFAAIGIFYAFIISILLVPALLALRPGAISPGRRRSRSRALGWIARITRRNRLIGLITAALVIFSVAGVLQVRTETNLRNFFQQDHPVNKGVRFLKNLFGAVNAIDFYVERADGRPLRPDDFRALARLRDAAAKETAVVDSVSVLTVGSLIAGGEEAFINSMNGDEADLMLALFRGNPTFRRQLGPKGEAARMIFLLSEDSAEYSLAFAGRVEELAANTAPGLHVAASGQSLLLARLSTRLLIAQGMSVGLILLFVTVVVSLVNRSLALGLISMIPNAAPILLTLGMMGWFGIPLNVITVMVSSIAIGIAVDDTIHFIHHLRGRLAEGVSSLDDAIHQTLQAKGRPIVFTSLLLTSAFLTLLLSNFQPTIYLGILSAMTMLSALVGDLFLLPMLLRLFSPLGRSKPGEASS